MGPCKKIASIEKSDILNITTEVERRVVMIDDEKCELKNVDEFDLQDYVWMTSVGGKFTGMTGEKLTKKKAQELTKEVNTLIDKVLIAKPEIKEKLSFNHKRQIMTFFLNGIQEENTTDTESSPDSNDSTEEIPNNGLTAPSG